MSVLHREPKQTQLMTKWLSTQNTAFAAKQLHRIKTSRDSFKQQLKVIQFISRVVACVTFDAHHSKELKHKLSARQGCMCVSNDSYRAMCSSDFKKTNGIFNCLHLRFRVSFWTRMNWNSSVTQAGPKHICGKIPTSNSRVLTLQV